VRPPLVVGLLGKRRKRGRKEASKFGSSCLNPILFSILDQDSRGLGGDRFWVAEGDRMVKTGRIGIQAGLNRSFHARLVFILRRPDVRGMDLVLGRSERTERGLRWWGGGWPMDEANPKLSLKRKCAQTGWAQIKAKRIWVPSCTQVII
jgi:hypothetical protein